ncbi:hypothetical protein E5D57_004666 [Metarhizium anisopliae]|nr:hypothetical protein E5D57_004666 [Metarhizium anisopliae]
MLMEDGDEGEAGNAQGEMPSISRKHLTVVLRQLTILHRCELQAGWVKLFLSSPDTFSPWQELSGGLGGQRLPE